MGVLGLLGRAGCAGWCAAMIRDLEGNRMTGGMTRASRLSSPKYDVDCKNETSALHQYTLALSESFQNYL